MGKNKNDMTTKDHLTRIYIGRNDIFADVVNYAVYNGEKVISPDILEDGDTVAASYICNGEGFKLTLERIRDTRKIVRQGENDKTCYMVFGAENQSRLHYAMPVRAMIYDAIEYVRQIENRKKTFEAISDAVKNGEKPVEVPPDSEEFLSSWKADDKLVPVVTIVINFSDKKWDAPVSIHQMLDSENDKYQRNRIIKDLVPDYRFILIDPHQMSEDDFNRMHTNLKAILRAVAYANDESKSDRLTGINEEITRSEAVLIKKLTGLNISVPKGEEVIKMGEGIKKLLDDSERKGKREGEANGENKLSALIKALENAGRKDDVFKAASDAEYRQKLYEEFGIE
ncbi:MAG: Rpn family recombination-promoting nuclease/putative transposase [Oscillospiraceae bacterium]|nr:Rpn family recombination-promoting nuclease/putative transposase [Oscillospiraceae bacterium]